MRTPHPNMTGKALFDYLIANKAKLINTKKSQIIYSEPFACDPSMVGKLGDTIKSMDGGLEEGVIRVKVVCNTANWCDSYMDVLAPDCWKKTIAERGPQGKNIIPHLSDHCHELEAMLGDVVSISSEMIDLKVLGYDAPGKAQALVMVSDVKEKYDEKIYALYSDLKVRQHSIGMMYVQLELCLNDENYKEEFAAWNKYYKAVINKDDVDGRGYFWYVTEIKLYENSAVLFGANELTPTLEVTTQPDDTTGKSDNTPKPTTLTSDQVKKMILLTNFTN